MAKHSAESPGSIHIPHQWEYADSTAREAASGFVASDVGKLALQESDYSFWVLSDFSPVTWVAIAGDHTQQEGWFSLAGGRNLNTTNSYLENVTGRVMNNVGYVVPKSKIMAISVATTDNETWDAEVRKNGGGSAIASTSITAARTKYEELATPVNLDEGDELQFYCAGNLISRPMMLVYLARRA
jgi:hypothetical protein